MTSALMTAPVTPDAVVDRVLCAARSFAVIGASNKPDRPSYGVMRFLIARGYTVVPVNPGLAGQTILDQPVYATLADVPGLIDVVDVFRNSDAALGVTREALAERARLGLKAIWMQLDVINEDAAAEATAAGLDVVMDRCPAIELSKG
jgi:uncharacterized protein